MKKTSRTCKAKTKQGDQCSALAIDGSDFCFFHDPEKAEDRHRAQSAGGRNGGLKTLSSTTPDARIEGADDVVSLLSDTINQVRRGDIDPRVANAVGYLANILLKAKELGDLEDRIKALEATTNRRTSPELELVTG